MCLFPLCSGIQHIFNEDTVAGSWIVHKDMCHRAYQFSVLYNRRAGHECVKCRTKFFYKFLRILAFDVENQRIIRHSTYWGASLDCEVHMYARKITLFFHYINVNIPRSSAEMKKTEAV